MHIYDLYPNTSGVMAGVSETPLFSSRTGQRGEFTFSVRPGSYRVEVIPDNTTRFLRHVVPEIKVNANTTCNLSLSTGSLLSGTITTKAGSILSGCEIVALGIEPSSYRSSAPVESSGKYSLVLPKGKFHIASRVYTNGTANGANGEEEQDENSSSSSSSSSGLSMCFVSTQVEVINIAADDSYDFVLPEMVAFTGEVTDVFGAPVKRARVRVAPSFSKDRIILLEMNLAAESQTDENGKFQIYVEPGTYDVSVEPSEPGPLFGLKEHAVEISYDLNRRFSLQEGHRLKGQVLYDDEPLSSSLIRLQGLDRKGEYIARTDRQGLFSVGVPGGTYKVLVIAHPKDSPTITIDGAEYSALAPWAREIVVGGDTHVEVKMQKGTALQGRICDDAGQARPGVKVHVFADSGKTPEAFDRNARAVAHGLTDGEGRYCIFLAPDKYWMVVHKDIVNAQLVDLGSEPVTIDVTWHGWNQVRFEIVGEDGQKVPRCQVRYVPYGREDLETSEPDLEDDLPDDKPYGYVITGEDGTCQLTLPSGVYCLRFVPPVAGSYAPKLIKQLSISSDLNRKINLDFKPEA